MAIIKNDDLKIMCEIEELLHNKIETEEEYDTWIKYWNMLERFFKDKDKSRQKAKDFNKSNDEYHRINVNLYNAKKKNDTKRIVLYEKQMKKYKKERGN